MTEKAAKRTAAPKKAAAPKGAGPIRNESDVDLYYPTLGVTLKPGESHAPKPEE